MTPADPEPDPFAALVTLASDAAPALRLPSAESLLTSLCRTARLVFRAAACSIATVDETAGELLYRAADGAGAEHVPGIRLPIERGIAGYVASAGQAVSISEVHTDPRFAADVAESTGYMPDTVLAVPITSDDGVLGVLTVLDPAPVEGTAALESLDTASAFAAAGAHALSVSAAVENFGGTLVRAYADAAEVSSVEPDVVAALRARAMRPTASDPDLAVVAARLGELRSLGPAAAATAGRLLDDLIAYARTTRGLRR